MKKRTSNRAHFSGSHTTRAGTVEIRPATIADAGRIAELSTQLGYPASKKEMKLRIATVARRNDQKIFAAVVDGVIAGWLEIFRPRSVLNWGKAEIGALVVDDRYRRRGVGNALMETAHAWAKKNHCPFVYLRSNVVRSDAHKFYKRSGYTVFKTQLVFRKLFRVPRYSAQK
ncbi:MAG TPA: GNAT family N-acetyltransferase [Bacteroidota bacterium]